MATELGAAVSSGVGAHRVDLETIASIDLDAQRRLGAQEREMRQHESLLDDQLSELRKQLAGKLSKKDRARIEVFVRNLTNDLNDVQSKGDALRLVLSGDVGAVSRARAEADSKILKLETQLSDVNQQPNLCPLTVCLTVVFL